MQKTVSIRGFHFDCLAGHIEVTGVGKASSLRVAAQRAIGNMLAQPQLSHRQIKQFSAHVVVSNAADEPKRIYCYSDANTFTDRLTLAEARQFQAKQNGGTIRKMTWEELAREVQS